METSNNSRFWEIDFCRGAAVLAMILFHSAFDLSFFGIYPVDVATGFWWVFSRAVASAFVFIAGISLTISYARANACGLTEREMQIKYIKRGAEIFSLGLVITAATWLFMSAGTIWFGILHFIGVATILGYLLMKYSNPRLNLVLAVLALLIGFYLSQMQFGFSLLLWLGFQPAGFMSFDYFPLLPWFGVFALGLFTGSCLYPQGKRSFTIPDVCCLPSRILCLIGSNSLLIYFLHQPILIGMLYLLFPSVRFLA
jgi:uncharacterized membrane protein